MPALSNLFPFWSMTNAAARRYTPRGTWSMEHGDGIVVRALSGSAIFQKAEPESKARR